MYIVVSEKQNAQDCQVFQSHITKFLEHSVTFSSPYTCAIFRCTFFVLSADCYVSSSSALWYCKHKPDWNWK